MWVGGWNKMHLSTLQQITVPDISHPSKACLEVYVVPVFTCPTLERKILDAKEGADVFGAVHCSM